VGESIQGRLKSGDAQYAKQNGPISLAPVIAPSPRRRWRGCRAWRKFLSWGALLAIFSPNWASQVRASSVFQLPSLGGGIWVGQNYDAHLGHGGVLLNPQGRIKTGLRLFDTDQTVSWTARYSSLTFNQIALDHPISGINEKGLLVIAVQNYGEGDPKADHGPTLNEFQWLQYQLDSYASLAELLDHLPEVGISSFSGDWHYLACDAAERRCAILEVSVVSHHLQAWSGLRLPLALLTNLPYDEALQRYRSFQSEGAPPFEMDPFDALDRFFYLGRILEGPGRGRVSRDVFQLLQQVRQPGYTQWQVAFRFGERQALASFHLEYQLARTQNDGTASPGCGSNPGGGSVHATLDWSPGSVDAGVDFRPDPRLPPAPETPLAWVADFEELKESSKGPKGRGALRSVGGSVVPIFTPFEAAHQVRWVDLSVSYLGAVLPRGGEERLKAYPESPALSDLGWPRRKSRGKNAGVFSQ
jgi:hypothetical protein